MVSKKPKRNVFKAFILLMQAAKSYAGALFLAIGGILIARASEGGIYKFLIPQTLDDGFIAKDTQFLQQMPLLILGIFTCLGLGEFLSKYLMGYVGRSVVRDYRTRMLNHLLAVPTAYYKQHTSGELISKINYDTEQVALAVSDAIKEFLNSIIAIVVLLTVVLSISWQVTLSILLVIPVVAGYLKLVGKAMRRYSSRVQKTMGHLTHVASEIIHGHSVIRVFQGIKYEEQRIIEATNNNRKQELKIFLIAALSSPMMQLIGGIILVGFIYLVTTDAIKLTPGQIFGVIGAMFALIRPLKQITEVNNVFQKGIAAVESIHTLLNCPTETDIGKHTMQCSKGQLYFNKVSFSYADKQNIAVLSDVSFKIDPGQTIALVGRSGSGKSTIAALLTRFYEPSCGRIYLDDLDIQSIVLKDLRQQFAVVTQQTTLFNDTVANNIAYGGASGAAREDIIAAARSANALEFIEQLPDGFDTPIGENGVLLSGGQRQRLAIARAILKDAPILILDEATSALDTESESQIQAALENLMRSRTTLVIAHRLSTIERADKILVLDKGKIIEQGTHRSLLALKGHYATLQQQAYVQELDTVE